MDVAAHLIRGVDMARESAAALSCRLKSPS